MQDTERPVPPELQMLMDALDRAEGPEARQRAWNALVEFQRQRGVRATPREAPDDGKKQ
jgi:hypothetical protein